MATTWTEPDAGDGARVSNAVCTTGTEAAPGGAGSFVDWHLIR